MKTKHLLLTALIIIFSSPAFCQFTFGVSPGLSLNGAQLGLKMNKVQPYISFQYLNAGLSEVRTYDEYDYGLNQTVSNTYESDVKLNLYLPTIGMKFFAIEQNNIKAYVNFNISKPIVTGKYKDNDGSVDFPDENIDNVSLWGSELGIGAEYFFDDNFSVGGEFGLRHMRLKYTESYSSNHYYDPYTGNSIEMENTYDYKFNVSPTYTKISLNYYFGSNKDKTVE